MFPTQFDLNRNLNDLNRGQNSQRSETEIKLQCSQIRIGSYSYAPRNKVRISSEGVTIVSPSLCTRTKVDDIILHIPLKNIVLVWACMEDALGIWLYTDDKTGQYVRSALNMTDNKGLYYDPKSSIESQKRITIVPTSLNKQHVVVLKTLFGMVLDEVDAKKAKAMLKLVRSDGDTITTSEDDERHSTHSGDDQPDSEAGKNERMDTEQNTGNNRDVSQNDKDDASSSSSVIFPPSPAPISLSSHSDSPHSSPKSSPSSRKRKNRHKKPKNNKKVKYVMVKNPEPHPVDAFLNGIAPMLKSLNPVFLNLAKSEIISAALKYERKMLTENCNGDT